MAGRLSLMSLADRSLPACRPTAAAAEGGTGRGAWARVIDQSFSAGSHGDTAASYYHAAGLQLGGDAWTGANDAVGGYMTYLSGSANVRGAVNGQSRPGRRLAQQLVGAAGPVLTHSYDSGSWLDLGPAGRHGAGQEQHGLEQYGDPGPGLCRLGRVQPAVQLEREPVAGRPGATGAAAPALRLGQPARQQRGSTQASVRDRDQAVGRLGARLNWSVDPSGQGWRTALLANLFYRTASTSGTNFSTGTATSYAGNDFGSWSLETGAEVQYDRRGSSVFLRGTYGTQVFGGSGHSLQGTLGVRYAF